MRLSIAVIAMSNLPLIRLVSWKTELGVGVTFTATPFLAKKPFSCATQIGQLKPPGKTIRLMVFGGTGWLAQPASSTATRIMTRIVRSFRSEERRVGKGGRC